MSGGGGRQKSGIPSSYLGPEQDQSTTGPDDENMLWIILTCLNQQAVCVIDHLSKEVDSVMCSG